MVFLDATHKQRWQLIPVRRASPPLWSPEPTNAIAQQHADRPIGC